MQLERVKKNSEIEIAGLDIAIKASVDKLKKRDEQFNSAEAQVRKQKDETRKILREFTPKLIRSFHKAAMEGVRSGRPSKLYQLAQVLVGLILKQNNVDQGEVDVGLTCTYSYRTICQSQRNYMT